MSIIRSRNRLFTVGIVLVLAILNISYLAWMRSPRSARIKDDAAISGPDGDLAKKRAKLTDWASDEIVPFTMISEWGDSISENGCMVVPPMATAVQGSGLSHDITQRFREAFIGLILGYADNSPEHLVKYMEEHREFPDPERMIGVKKLLSNIRKAPIEKLSGLEAGDILTAFWREAKYNSHWAGVLSNSGCCQFWSLDILPDAKLRQSLTKSESNLFQNEQSYNHSFIPVASLESVLTANSVVLFADIKFVVKLDSDSFSRAVPFFLRFWYEPAAETWHPFQFARVMNDEGSEASVLFF